MAANPETFQMIADNNINLFHGTNSNALPSILKYGMKSVDESEKSGITVSTGEEWSRPQGRSFISFTDDIRIAENYSLIGHSSKNKSFPVIVGISTNDLKNMRTCRVLSELPEIGIRDSVPLEYIKFIGVPQENMKYTKRLAKKTGIPVLAVDEILERPYQMNSWRYRTLFIRTK